jgi:hypothetical protein
MSSPVRNPTQDALRESVIFSPSLVFEQEESIEETQPSDDDQAYGVPVGTETGLFRPLTSTERNNLSEDMGKNDNNVIMRTIAGAPKVHVLNAHLKFLTTAPVAEASRDIQSDIIKNQCIHLNEIEPKKRKLSISYRMVRHYPPDYFSKIESSHTAYKHYYHVNVFAGYSFCCFYFRTKVRNKKRKLADNDAELSETDFSEFNSSVWVLCCIKIQCIEPGGRRLDINLISSRDVYTDKETAYVNYQIRLINNHMHEQYEGFGLDKEKYRIFQTDSTCVIQSYEKRSFYTVLAASDLLARVLKNTYSEEIDDETLSTLFTSVLSTDDFQNHLLWRIAYALAFGGSIHSSEEELKPDIKYINLKSSFSGSSIGGNSLDMSGATLPCLQASLYHAVGDYNITFMEWAGTAAGPDQLNTGAKLDSLGSPLMIVGSEILYCYEMNPNVKKLLTVATNRGDDITLNKILNFHGVSCTDLKPEFNKVDTGRGIFSTSAILPPLPIIRVFMMKLVLGYLQFIFPVRTIMNVFCESVLGRAAITCYHIIEMKLSGSGCNLPLGWIILQGQDALGLYK